MSSRQNVTITLGRSGQVVKRAGTGTDSEIKSSSDRKRPIRERLGNNTDNSYSYGSQDNNKRQRTENSSWNSGDDHLSNDELYTSNRRIGRDDLRFKLVNKSLARRSSDAHQQHKVDLREKLSRSAQGSPRFDTREHAPRTRNSDPLRRIPPTRSADDLLRLESLRKTYSSWTLDGLRHRSPDRHRSQDRHRSPVRHRSPGRRRSPDRLLGASRGTTPPRNYADLRHTSSIKSNDALRSTSYMRNGVVDVSRPTFMSKPIPVDTAKPVLRAPPPGGIIHKTSFTVDMTALKQMGDNDLKELGIPMGPRKKILLALIAHSKHRQR